MRTPTLIALAASAALLPGAALAQQQAQGGRAGVTWQGGGMHGGAQMPHMPRPHMPMPPRGGMHMPPGGGHGGWAGGGMQWRGGHFRPGPGFSRHVVRGGFIHPFWFGNQFQINNWQAYGFASPGADQRWVRYYDDAYLVDRGGRVVDSREGLDWDQYGERWDVEDGIPAYYGSRDYTPGDEDYAWAERQRGDIDEDYAEGDDRGDRDDRDGDRDHRRGRHHGERHGGGHEGGGWDYSAYDAAGGGAAYGYGGPAPGPGYGYGGPMPAPGGGTVAVYGGGYGYGMYAYPIVIETTTTQAAATSYVEIVEEVIETRARARRHVRRPCRCAPARPRPPAGERG